MQDEEKKKKEMGDNPLKRSVHSDVAVYAHENNPAPGVYSGKMARTIVPRDGEIDQSLGSQNKMAGEPGRYMASGGFVYPEDDNKLMLDGLTPGTSQQMPPAPAAPPMTRSVAPMAPSPSAMPSAPPPQLPGMPPEMTVDELEPYLNKQKASLNFYGPEAQMALQQKTLADQNSLGSRATSGLKGLADSIMMGVAGAGNPGFQQQYETQQDRQAAEQMDTLQKASASNIQRTEANMSLDKLDANSPLSKAAQENFGPLLTKALGIPEAQIKKMSAAQIQTNTELGLKYADIESQGALKQATIELQSMLGNANIANQKAQQDIAKANAKREAALATSKGSSIPFVGPSHRQKVEAINTLANQAAGVPEFDSEGEAAAAGLPDGTPVVIGGVKGKWRHQ